MTDLTRYLLTFSTDGIADVSVLMDAAPPQVTGGYGGWTVTNRMRRVGLTQWQGKDPLRMSLPILFDGVRDGAGQEIAISRLSRMALPPVGGGEPPVISIDGPGFQSPGPTQWVIENLQWGQNVIQEVADNGVMVRLRQDCVVNVLEYRGDDRLAFKTGLPGVVTGKSKGGWPKQYVVKAGDTIQKIAVFFYKDSNKWKKIAQANGIRDPKTISRGQVLIIPAP